MLDAYVAGGGNFIDTADAYSAWAPGNKGGESETVLGNWLASRGNRSDVVIATKVGALPDLKGLSAATIKSAVDGVPHASAHRLHRPLLHPLRRRIGRGRGDPHRSRRARAGRQGPRDRRVQHLGASAWRSPWPSPPARAWPATSPSSPTTTWSPATPTRANSADVAARHGLAAVPYFALASGFLTGKYRPGTTVDSARSGGALKYVDTDRGQRVLQALDTVAAAHEAEPATIALAWLAAQPTVAAPIASARTVEQLPALLAVADLTLTEAELALLNEASA